MQSYGNRNLSASRWNINPTGSITWNPTGIAPHYDHIEMSGKRVSVVLRYGVDISGAFQINKSLVWPMLRTNPNDTHASLMRQFEFDPCRLISVNGKTPAGEKVESITLKGIMTVASLFDMGRTGKFNITRVYLPSTENQAFIELYTITNTGERNFRVEIPDYKVVVNTAPDRGVDGSYRLESVIDKSGEFILKPGEKLEFNASIAGYKNNEQSIAFNYKEELAKREVLVEGLLNNLVLETPEEAINTMFAFSKIRACESIYQTKGGAMHGPGGESYYAAIWANDQAEYINPYFPFTGYAYGNESALNSYLHFARFMNDKMEPIPSSIIAEGVDIWNGAGDRGDAAMIAYGAARYALARGSKEEARQLWPLIKWCLEYCNQKLTKEGVVASDSDELEGRFPAGNANLCTSSLYYDALLSASYLVCELGENKSFANKYRNRAKALRSAIENYFGANVEGFDTYAYYKGNDILRSWICIPLTVGINQRAEGTINALFSDRLWTKDGLLTQAGSTTFWDRSTLYALRGAYIAGESKRATDFLTRYSTTRLLGEHVPYAIEAWPEGSQRHLSAESGLYGRIITEGLFGIRPTGFNTFDLTCRLPDHWDHMALRKIKAFGKDFDIEVVRDKEEIVVKLTQAGKVVMEKRSVAPKRVTAEKIAVPKKITVIDKDTEGIHCKL
ncbi:MAG: hypothetical protein RR555_04165 [Bacteroidales bacterium]